jgi:hypothetical protein
MLGQLGGEILHAARRWAYARAALRRLLDSKTAKPDQVQRAKTEYIRASDQLERCVGKMERALQQAGVKGPPRRRQGVSLQQMLGLVANMAGAAEAAITNPQAAVRAAAEAGKEGFASTARTGVDDDGYMEGEVIDATPKKKRKD